MLVPGLDPFHHLASIKVKLTKCLLSAVLPTLCFPPTYPFSIPLFGRPVIFRFHIISATTTSSIQSTINAQASKPLDHCFGRHTERVIGYQTHSIFPSTRPGLD
jgi:hypothetical protein